MSDGESGGGNDIEIPETLDQIGEGIAKGAEQIPEDEPEARAGAKTTADAVNAAAGVMRAIEAAPELVEAAEAGDAARIAGSAGNLVGGIGGAAGGLLQGTGDVLDAIPGVGEDVRSAFHTAGNVASGIGRVARATEQVVHGVQAIMAAFEGRRVVFQTDANLGEGQLVAEHAHGVQHLSGLYELTVRVEHDEEGGLDDQMIDEVLTSHARLGLTRGSDGSVYGIVRQIEMQPVHAPRPTHYDLVLVPTLWRLSIVKRSRAFHDKSHLDIVREILRHHGLDDASHFADHTEETYPVHEYTVQYQETDLDFIRRLLAHNGIHFHFVQDQGSEVMILGDRNAAFEPVQGHGELVYHAHDFAPDDNVPRLWDLRRVRKPVPRSMVLRDYNWRTPHTPLRAEEHADDESGYGFCDEFGDHFPDDAEGRRLARIRAEEQRVYRDTFTAKTSLRGVCPGSYFDLREHPHEHLNQRYIVIESREQMDDGGTYLNEIEAIPYSVTYRPPRLAWPRIEGIVNAIVDGEQRSTATSIDDQGRYRVTIPFDEATSRGGRASRWVRRAQPSAGAGYGMHFPLHIGTEVAIGHVNGDPDRPIILGAVPNAATPSPVVAANGPQSRIRTGSGIVFELDDDC